jgi:NAD(P)-dependent dehydrogenase (short-subunit alcohol dehydrogenase family)
MARPDRLVYLSSGMHQGGSPTTYDLDWRDRPWRGAQAYSDSKLYDATLAAAVARRWPEVLSNAVDPGWVPTRMGGAGAPGDLDKGHQTQVWLAVSDDPEVMVSGRYLFHRRERGTHPAVHDEGFQEDLLAALADLTRVEFPDRPGPEER